MSTTNHIEALRQRNVVYRDTNTYRITEKNWKERIAHTENFIPSGVLIRITTEGADNPATKTIDINQIFDKGIGKPVFRCPYPDCCSTFARRDSVRRHFRHSKVHMHDTAGAIAQGMEWHHHVTISTYTNHGKKAVGMTKEEAERQRERNSSQPVQQSTLHEVQAEVNGAAKPDGSKDVNSTGHPGADMIDANASASVCQPDPDNAAYKTLKSFEGMAAHGLSKEQMQDSIRRLHLGQMERHLAELSTWFEAENQTPAKCTRTQAHWVEINQTEYPPQLDRLKFGQAFSENNKLAPYVPQLDNLRFGQALIQDNAPQADGHAIANLDVAPLPIEENMDLNLDPDLGFTGVDFAGTSDRELRDMLDQIGTEDLNWNLDPELWSQTPTLEYTENECTEVVQQVASEPEHDLFPEITERSPRLLLGEYLSDEQQDELDKFWESGEATAFA